MSVALDIGIVVLLLAVLAAQFVIFPAMWIGFRDQWRHMPPGNRRRGIAGGAVSAIFVASGMLCPLLRRGAPTASFT